MPKDKLRELVYKADVETLLQDGLKKVIDGYTTFEEVLKIIELDDDEVVGAIELKNAIDAARVALGEKEDEEKKKQKEYLEKNAPKKDEDAISKPSIIENPNSNKLSE